MNKTAIKNYAVWARVQLIEAVRQRAFEYKITEGGENKPDLDSINGRVLSANEKEQRATLTGLVKQKGYAQVMEEAAYTWFNRFIALRFMEVNGYLPSKTRVFTDENNNFKPEILKQAMTVELDGLDREKVYDLLDKQNNEELYKYLLITQCNALNASLPDMFEKIANWTELLFPNNLLKADSVLERMILEIPENDWTEQVEIIGWLYQYYNTEPKDVLINAHKKYKKDDLPFVTQLFTSEWIVKYLVDNSVGRYWIERHPNSPLKNELQFYIDSEDLTTDFENKEITEIKIYDPCIGSGHFLVYAFDVLMKIYKEIGYSERDAAQIIVKNNLYGLDIDNRANQLAFFSVMMKARSFDRRFLTRGIYPNIFSIQESNSINTDYFTLFGELQPIAQKLTAEFVDAKIYGSILNFKITAEEITQLENKYNEIVETVYDNFFDSVRQSGLRTLFAPLINQAKIMIQKYDIICTNPPYLNSSYMPDKLKNYVINNYKDYKSDLFAVFIYKTTQTLNKDGYLGILTPYVWMFISSYEKLRENIIKNTNISTLVQLEYNAFEAACVPVCAFVINKTTQNRFGEYIKLSDFKGIENQEPKTLEAINNKNCGYRFTANADNFSKIPGSPIAYWVSENFINAFENGQLLGDIIPVKKGMDTGNNDYFIKLWFEVNSKRIDFFDHSKKWIPYDKGGDYRKWYGNNEYILNWEYDGLELRNSKANLRSKHLYFRPSITWSALSSSNTSFRFSSFNGSFDSAGSSMFPSEDMIPFYLGLMNTTVSQHYLNVINPTLNYGAGSMGQSPIIIPKNNKILDDINSFVDECITHSKTDWDSFETSWDFKKHPLI